METLAGMFSSGSAATSATTMAAENAALAQAGSTAASVQAAGQGAIAAQTAGATAGQVLQYVGQGATLLQGVSSYQSGVANASLLNEGARSSRAIGAANKDIRDARYRAALGELRAQSGAQGTTIGSLSDSPMLVYLDSVRNAAIESQTDYWQGATRATTLKTQASFARKGGQNDLWAGIIGAAGPSIANLGSRLLG
jgi:hypothetical protein